MRIFIGNLLPYAVLHNGSPRINTIGVHRLVKIFEAAVFIPIGLPRLRNILRLKILLGFLIQGFRQIGRILFSSLLWIPHQGKVPILAA